MRKKTVSQAVAATVATMEPPPKKLDDFDLLAAAVQAKYNRSHVSGEPIFNVGSSGLWNAYLSGFATQELRQHHDCDACRRFIERYGGAVAVSPLGRGDIECLLWEETNDVPAIYRESIRLMRMLVQKGSIMNLVLGSEKAWGHGPNHDNTRDVDWTHFQILGVPVTPNFAGKNPWQQAAEKKEEVGIVGRAIGEFSIETIERACKILEGEHLFRGERHLPAAQWLRDMAHSLQRMPGQKTPNRNSIIWAAVAKAPAGFTHIRQGMLGGLLERLQGGSFEDAKAWYDAAMAPDAYQRPTTPPKAGNVKQAEKLFEELDCAKSLERRYARLEELQAIWTPQPEKQPQKEGVFSHLLPSTRKGPEAIGTVSPITWTRFVETVLPKAERIELLVPTIGNFIAFTTAVHADAKPLLQWDFPDARNPVSTYVYIQGSHCSQWALKTGWCDVDALVLHPCNWHPTRKLPSHGEGVSFILHGARETGTKGRGFFIESIRSEFESVKPTIEAYLEKATVQGGATPMAAGLCQNKGGGWNCSVRVTSQGFITSYNIDRWV